MDKRRLSLIALLATGALLSACSGGTSSSSDGADHSADANQTFAFGGVLGPVETIHVELPKPLLDAMGADADNLLVTAVDLKAHKLDSAKYCAVDVTRTFADGALEKLSALEDVDPTQTSEYRDRLMELVQSLRPGEDPSVTLNALAESGALKANPGPERDERLRTYGLEGFDIDAYNAGKQRISDEIAAEIQKADPVANLMHIENAKPLSELNEASPEPGRYMNDDASVITDVMKCALDPFADSTSDTGVETVRITKTGSSSAEDFAYFRYSVMKDGKITITDSKVHGYHQDSSGNWLQK